MSKRTLKIIFWSGGVFLLLLVLLAFAVPVLFRDRLDARIKSTINSNVHAVVDYKDLDISLFRRFPYLSIELQELRVVGKDECRDDTLLYVPSFDLAVNLFSALRGRSITISKITLDHARIHVKVLKNGKPNWDIALSDSIPANSSTSTSSTWNLQLKKYYLKKSTIIYEDASYPLYLSLKEIDHLGSGDFSSDVFNLSTETTSPSVSFSYNNISYLNNAALDADVDLQIESSQDKYTFRKNVIKLNDLQLAFDGVMQLKK